MALDQVGTVKLGALAHYVIWHCGSMNLGATKLRKVLWFSDVEAYRLFGRSISGATAYEKRQHGPVPFNIYNELAALKAMGLISQETVNAFGYARAEYTALKAPDLAVFEPGELAIVDEVAEIVCRKHTASSISALSHDALWDETPIGGPISIAAAAVTFAKPSADDLAWAEETLSQL